MIIKQTIFRILCAAVLLTGRLSVPAQEYVETVDSADSERLEIQSRIQSMTDEVKQIYVSSQMLPPAGKEGTVKATVAKAIGERLKVADRAMKSLDFKWNTYYQTIQPVIAEDDELMEKADFFLQISQAVRDTLDNTINKVNLLQAFCEAEAYIPAQVKEYEELYKKAMGLSMVKQLAAQLDKLKGEEKLQFGGIQVHYDKAQEATKTMPGLQKRMVVIDQNYIVLKANSEKIQAAEYKPLFQRIKDYVMGLAAVAILLMFVSMMTSKLQAFKKNRESMKKMKEMMNNAGGNDNFIPTIALLPFFMFLLSSCDDEPQMLKLDGGQEQADSSHIMALSKPEFSDKYKTIVLEGRLGSEVGMLPLSDKNKVRIEVTEVVHHLSEASYPLPPKMVKVEELASHQVQVLGIRALALVDLSLPQTLVEQERKAVGQMRNLFSDKNLFVAFIKGTSVTESVPVTDYVMKNYFVSCDSTRKYLYRSILAKIDEMEQDSSWAKGAKHTAMVIMSDGATYQDDKPMDPRHFQIEHQLANCSLNSPLYYAEFSTEDDDSGDADVLGSLGDFTLQPLDDMDIDTDDASVLQSRCIASRGLYQKDFNWSDIQQNIQNKYGMDMADYRFTLENPNHKVYRGRHGRDLQIACYDVETDSLLVQGNCFYSLGSVYRPVIVNPSPLYNVLMQGIIYAALLALLVYAILQFLVPYIRYRLFQKNHIVTYSKTQVGAGGLMVAESCYLCKAPFEEGDQVVTKCQHAMHLDCWNENQYQCPEYGRHCEHGRHYYNRQNLLDPQNATFYMDWIIAAIIAGVLAWIFYTAQMHPFLSTLAEKLILTVTNTEPDTAEGSAYLAEYGASINHFPAFGLCIGFFLTLMLSCMSVAKREPLSRAIEILLRAILGGLGSLLFFTLGGIISVALGLQENAMIIDWIPWSLTGYWIALCVTWGTRIRIRHYLVIGAFVVGLVSTYLWTWLYAGSTVDYRVTLLINFILFAVAMAISIAKSAPRSERYFLTVSGIIKQMDVALYKWFKANPNDVVTIGHSVDSHLQLSWDIQSKIAPIQAEIRLDRGVPRLYALEEGVFVAGKPAELGKGIRLYHGKTFTIGQTTFTYIEKDN
ncbi:MAG: E3 ubiquitin protein ligase [Prevotella sp.]|nr:E3 ubiquitin protein ligase [Prevotella sp.]